jgi:acyl-coenzyme A synthetase/AMP-(fatty) acid ligase
MLLLLKRKPEKRGLFVTAGEKLRPQDYIDFESGYGSLVNLYGCTEMGAIATSDLADPLASRAQGQVKPLPGVEMEISPQKMILCKHPAAFEYYIDPLGRKRTDGQKAREFYPTGDLGFSPSAHRFILLGRADHCINRCGFLVSIQEIEHTLMDLFTEVEQVTVIISAEDNLRGPGLIAICQLKKGSDPGKEYAKARCTGHMPGHWIPDEFHFVPDLPRLPSGKPDRIFLQQMYLTLIHKQS